MRNFLIPSFLFGSAILLGSFAACSSDTINPPTNDGGPTADVTKPEGGSKDASVADGEGGMVTVTDISGTDQYVLTVVSGPFSGPGTSTDKGTPVAGAAVRVETFADNGLSFLDFMTDSTGKVTMALNSAKGPFNITAASAMIGMVAGGAGSVINVKAPADIAGKVMWLPQLSQSTPYAISGAVTGLTVAADQTQLDCAAFATKWGTGTPVITNYTTQQYYDAADPSTVNIAGLEIDKTTACYSGPCVVKGVWTPDHMRIKGPMTGIDVDFSASPQTPAKATINIALPTTGVLPAANVVAVGDLTGQTGVPAYTNSTVERLVGQSAAYVGIGTLKKPTGSTAVFNMQYFTSGNLKPDVATIELNDIPAMPNGHANFLTIFLKTFTDASTTTAPPAVTKLLWSAGGSGNPTAMDDATLDFDGSPGDWAFAGISEVNTATFNRTVWNLYQLGKTGTAQHVPHLPQAVMLSDITSATNVELYVSVLKGGGVPTDFADGTGPGLSTLADWRYEYITEVAATGR